MLHDACSAQPAREGLLLSLRVEQPGQLLRSSDNLAARCVISYAYSILSPFRALARGPANELAPSIKQHLATGSTPTTLLATARPSEDGSAHRHPRLAQPDLDLTRRRSLEHAGRLLDLDRFAKVVRKSTDDALGEALSL